MRDKVIIIKDILKIIISVLIIITALKSCSFASSYELSSTDIQTICNHFFTGNKATLYTNAFLNNYNSNKNQYDTCAIAVQTYNNGVIAITYFNKADVTEIHNPQNVNYMGITINGNAKYSSLTFVPGGRWGTDKVTTTNTNRTGTFNFGSGAQLRTNWLFVSDSILTFNGPWESSQLIGPFTTPTIWDYTYSTSTRVAIPKLNITAHAIQRKWNTTELGTLEDSRYLEKVEAMFMYYDNEYQDWIILNQDTIYDYNINGSVLDNFVTDTTTNDPNWISYIYMNSKKFKNNMIFRVKFIPDEYNQEYNELEALETWYIVTDNNTIITNGELNETETFSGDYKQEYEEAINNQIAQNENDKNQEEMLQGINDINSNINNVNNTIINENENNKTWLQEKVDEWFKIESGDIIEIVESTINDIKMGSGEIAVDLQILNYIRDGEAEDFIISWENANPNLTIKGEPIPIGDGNILQSMGYMIPSNQINFSKMERENETFHSVMTWERIIINLSILMIIANQFYLVILQLFGVATTEYGHNQEEKRNLQRVQEAEKAKIRSQLWNANQEKIKAYERLARQRGWKK